MYYLYILKSLKDGKHYTGTTGNLEKRLNEHNIGKNLATKHRRPFVLVHTETFSSRAEAMQRERYLKTPKGAYEKHLILGKLEEFVR